MAPMHVSAALSPAAEVLMHNGHPSHIILSDLHICRLDDVMAGGFALSCYLTDQHHIEITVEAIYSSRVTALGDHTLGIACSGKELMHPAHHRAWIVPYRKQSLTCLVCSLHLRLAEVAPHRFFDV